MDIVDTYNVTSKAIARAREEHQPILVEAVTYRFRGHSVADPEEYRTKEEVLRWRRRDPITTFSEQLIAADILSKEQCDVLDQQAVARVDEAVAFADASPEPLPESLYDDIYVLGGQVQGWYSVDERAAGVHRGEDERRLAQERRNSASENKLASSERVPD
jgi:TPP-dependent pyruvate/acetoin dehydrogenase alpha subunit